MTLPSVLAGLGVKSPLVPNSCGYFQSNLKNAEFLLFLERMWLRWPIAHLTLDDLAQAAWSRIRRMYTYMCTCMYIWPPMERVLLVSCCYDDDCLHRWRCLVNCSWVTIRHYIHFLALCPSWPFFKFSHGIIDRGRAYPRPQEATCFLILNTKAAKGLGMRLGKAWAQYQRRRDVWGVWSIQFV
jgi:hypothetical protein